MDSTDILDDVSKQIDLSCHPDSNVQHLKHLLVGYRDFIINGSERSEYCSGSARDVSWHIGADMAKHDLDIGKVANVKKGETEATS